MMQHREAISLLKEKNASEVRLLLEDKVPLVHGDEVLLGEDHLVLGRDFLVFRRDDAFFGRDDRILRRDYLVLGHDGNPEVIKQPIRWRHKRA